MKIEDKITVEKSALSSGKIDKYEYLTGEEIMPSSQKQIIKQAKCAYSPLGKTFEKQTKTIEDKREKQIKAIEDNKKQLGNNELLLWNKRDIFKNIYNKILNKIDELSKKMIMVTWNSLLIVVV